MPVKPGCEGDIEISALDSRSGNLAFTLRVQVYANLLPLEFAHPPLVQRVALRLIAYAIKAQQSRYPAR